jgi:hypothetical protein
MKTADVLKCNMLKKNDFPSRIPEPNIVVFDRVILYFMANLSPVEFKEFCPPRGGITVPPAG